MLNMLMKLLLEFTHSEGSVFESTLCTRSSDPRYV